MRRMLISIGTVALALAGTVLLAFMSTATSLVGLAARTSVLIMGGSGSPLTTEQDGLDYVEQYLSGAVDNVVQPASGLPGTGIPTAGPDGYNAVAVITPAEFFPQGELTYDESVAEGLVKLDTCITGAAGPCVYNTDVADSEAPAPEDTFVVYGFSQSSTIATFEKRALAATYADGEGPDVSFVLIANGNRPNGGFLARGPEGVTIPLWLSYGGATFSGPTPTDTQYATVDFAIQYDLWADGPVNPLNLVAWANAMVAVNQLHPYSVDMSLDDPGIIDQGQYGDTSYYLAATETLPLLTPLEGLPLVGEALAQTLDPFFRVVVEAGYDREASPGEPLPWNVFYGPDPVEFATNLALAIPTGVDNGIEYYLDVRPFGTTAPGPYGIGGPEVTWLNPPAEESEAQTVAPEAETATDAAAGSPDEPTPEEPAGDVAEPVSVTDDADTSAPTRTAGAENGTQTASDPEAATDIEVIEVIDEPSDSDDEPTERDGTSTDEPSTDGQDDVDTVEQVSQAEAQDDSDERSDDGANGRGLVGARNARSAATPSTADATTSTADSGSEAGDDD